MVSMTKPHLHPKKYEVGILPYDDGSGNLIDLSWEENSDDQGEEYWPGGMVRIEGEIICGLDHVDALIAGLTNLKAVADGQKTKAVDTVHPSVEAVMEHLKKRKGGA